MLDDGAAMDEVEAVLGTYLMSDGMGMLDVMIEGSIDHGDVLSKEKSLKGEAEVFAPADVTSKMEMMLLNELSTDELEAEGTDAGADGEWNALGSVEGGILGDELTSVGLYYMATGDDVGMGGDGLLI